VIEQLKEEIQQYEGQESRHARESVDYEDCIEQLETELKYALERNNEGKYYAEENLQLRKTIQKMDAEVDELQTTMKIFSTGESGSSIAAITMGRALGPELMTHMDDERQMKDQSSAAQTVTITKGTNYVRCPLHFIFYSF
jgi:predicted RNase H-like nuclease (RuvC/YqgF family)